MRYVKVRSFPTKSGGYETAIGSRRGTHFAQRAIMKPGVRQLIEARVADRPSVIHSG